MNCILKGDLINIHNNNERVRFDVEISDFHHSSERSNIVSQARMGLDIRSWNKTQCIYQNDLLNKYVTSRENLSNSQRLYVERNRFQKRKKQKSQKLISYLNNQTIIENLGAQSFKGQIVTKNIKQVQKFKFQSKTLILNNENKEISVSLRGGGCGASKLERRIQTQQEESINQGQLPSYFVSDLVKYLNIIINKAQLASDEQQKEEILLALQWFIIMREHFNTLCIDSKSAASVYDLIFSSIPSLLKSTVTYVRISGFLCIQVLQIINDLCRILFTFFMKNNKRFLKIQDKEYFDELVQDFETQLEIEQSNIWVAGAEFEITMIKAVIQSSPSNSDEGQKLLVQFLGGLVQSVLTMSPTDDLIDSLIGGAKFLYQAHQVEDLKKKYEIYYYFESLKWYMIQLLRQDVSIKRVIQLLKSGFMNYIENQNDWLLNFCWVKMITQLITYRPIIQKQQISMNKVEQQQRWNQLIKYKFISQLSFNTNLGRLMLCQNIQNQETHTLNQLIQKLGLRSFIMFSETFLKSLEYSQVNLFSFKEKGEQQQMKIDYIYDILFGNYQLEESIEIFNELLIGYEKLFLKQSRAMKDIKTIQRLKQKNIYKQKKWLIM